MGLKSALIWGLLEADTLESLAIASKQGDIFWGIAEEIPQPQLLSTEADSEAALLCRGADLWHKSWSGGIRTVHKPFWLIQEKCEWVPEWVTQHAVWPHLWLSQYDQAWHPSAALVLWGNSNFSSPKWMFCSTIFFWSRGSRCFVFTGASLSFCQSKLWLCWEDSSPCEINTVCAVCFLTVVVFSFTVGTGATENDTYTDYVEEDNTPQLEQQSMQTPTHMTKCPYIIITVVALQ